MSQVQIFDFGNLMKILSFCYIYFFLCAFSMWTIAYFCRWNCK